MPGSTKNLLIALVLFVGVALVVAGESFYWYVNATISNLEMRLLQVGLPQNEHDALQGSLNWWQAEKASTFVPISIFVIIAGIVIVLFLIAYCASNIVRNGPSEQG